MGNSPTGKLVGGVLGGAQGAANMGLGLAGGVTRGVVGSEDEDLVNGVQLGLGIA